MDFNEKEWRERLSQTKNGEDLRKMIAEIPLPDTSLTSKEGRESSTTEQIPASKPSTSIIRHGKTAGGLAEGFTFPATNN